MRAWNSSAWIIYSVGCEAGPKSDETGDLQSVRGQGRAEERVWFVGRYMGDGYLITFPLILCMVKKRDRERLDNELREHVRIIAGPAARCGG